MHAGRYGRILGDVGDRQRAAERAFDRFAGQAARPQQCRLADAGDDRRLHADTARTGIDDEVDAAAQIGEHVSAACRRDVSRTVCRWRYDRPLEGLEQVVRNMVVAPLMSRKNLDCFY